MLVIIYNKSRKRRLRTSRRILSSILFPINDRLHIGNIPSRTVIELIKKLKEKAGKGTNIKFFIESKEGYHGFKMIAIGKKEEKFDIFEDSNSNIDKKLIKEKIIPLKYFEK